LAKRLPILIPLAQIGFILMSWTGILCRTFHSGLQSSNPCGHLMIAPADSYIGAFKDAGVDLLTVHAEAGPHLHRSLQAIRALGLKAGAAINPGTPVSALESVIELLDLVLVMSVNPGFGGQAFIPGSVEKIAQAKALIGGRNIEIEVDGGVTENNAAALTKAGATVLVAGSAIFSAKGIEGYRTRIDAIRAQAVLGFSA
jgi:ribulose-phosphate 3-epimerase